MTDYLSRNPFSGELLSRVHPIDSAELNTLLNAQAEKNILWSNTELRNRKAYLLNIPKTLESKIEFYAKTISNEMGKPINQSKAEIRKCIDLCYWFLENGVNFLENNNENQDSKSRLRYDPTGSILGVMPWNFPFWQIFRFAFPTILLGNTVFLKHAPNVPQCASLLGDIFDPDNRGIFHNLYLENQQVELVISHDSCTGLAFTGSLETGKHLAGLAGKNMIPSCMELGGSDSFIVCQSADLSMAVNAVISSRMNNSGQTCISSKRLFVHSSIYLEFKASLLDRYSKLIIADPFDVGTDIGPLARMDLVDKYRNQISTLISGGSKPLIVIKPSDSNLSPSLVNAYLFEGKDAIEYFSLEEVFGPALAMDSFDSNEEVILRANSSHFGLGSTLFTDSAEDVQFFTRNMEVGALSINKALTSDFSMPFGGTKNSGYGRELGIEGMLYFSNKKLIQY